MRRVLLAIVMIAAASLAPVTSARAADDWQAKGWYGWITIAQKGSFSGDDITPSGTDFTRRIRVKGSTARVVSAAGTAYSLDDSNPECWPRTDWTYLGPGAALPFGNIFEVLPGAGSEDYRLSGFHLSVRTRVDESYSPASCGTASASIVDHAEGFEVGCGVGTACTALSRSRLHSQASYTEVFTWGAVTTTASWHLTDDADTDPCRTVADKCLDTSLAPQVLVAPTGSAGDLGAACGSATFTWRAVTGAKRTVKKGEQACVFLVGNDLARKLLAVSRARGVPLGVAFAGTILHKNVVTYGGATASWAERYLASGPTLSAIGEAMKKSVARFNQITVAGKVAKILAVPLAGGFIVNQIKNKNACMQVIVDTDGAGVKPDWSMVYARTTDQKLTKAKVYEKVAVRSGVDRNQPVMLGMQCTPAGRVVVSGGKSKAMKSRTTTYFKLR